MASYRQILDEVTRKPGDVWKTSAGTWAGKRGDKTQYGLADKDKAQAYVAGKDVEGEEEPSEKEPKKPSGKENPKRERGGKDKTLTDVDTSNSEFYNEEINPPDSKYETPKGYETPPPPFKFPEDISNGKFPKKYATLVERMMNSQRKGKKPPITDFITGGGARKSDNDLWKKR